MNKTPVQPRSKLKRWQQLSRTWKCIREPVAPNCPFQQDEVIVSVRGLRAGRLSRSFAAKPAVEQLPIVELLRLRRDLLKISKTLLPHNSSRPERRRKSWRHTCPEVFDGSPEAAHKNLSLQLPTAFRV